MSSRTGLPLLLVLTSLLTIAMPAHAQGEAKPGAQKVGRNIEITITVGNPTWKDASRTHTYRMLVREDAPRARMLMGWRTPIPTARAASDKSGDAPVTTYVYQNVGMTAQMEARMLEPGWFLLEGTVELSGARALPGVELPPDMPAIGTFQQEISVRVQEGKPLRVAEVPDPDGGTLYLQIEASLQD